MKKDAFDMDDFPQQERRFLNTMAEGQCGPNKQHKSNMKLRKGGIVKIYPIQKDKTVQQLIDQFNAELEEEQKMKKSVVALVNDPKKKSKIFVDKKQTLAELHKQGLNDIQLESAIDQNGDEKYPQLPPYKGSQGNYFQPPKVVSKIKKVVLSIKLIYQSIDKQDMVKVVAMEASQNILDLKIKTKNAFGIPSIQSIFLQEAFTGIFQTDSQTLEELQIKNNAQIYVRVIETSACFPGDSKIKVISVLDNKKTILQKSISEIKIGDSIVSYNIKGFFEQDKVTYVQSCKSKTLMQIITQKGSSVKSSISDLYLTKQGWKKYSVIGRVKDNPEIQKQKISENDFVITCNSNSILSEREKISEEKIKVINVQSYQQSIELYHLSIQKNHTYIVNNFIVHNMQIIVEYLAQNVAISIDAQPTTLIKEIKQTIAIQFKLKQQSFNLLFVHKELEQKKSLTDYGIAKGDKLQVSLKINKPNQPVKPMNEKWLIIKDNQQVFKRKYQLLKNKQVYQIIEQIKNICPKYASLLHGNTLLKPLDKISIVQNNQNFKISNQITCILVQNVEKMLFYDLILTKDYKQIISNFQGNQNGRAQMLKKFRNVDFNKAILDQIFRFDPSDEDSMDQIFLKDLRQIILFFISIGKYINQTAQYQINVNNALLPRSILQYNLYKRQRFNGFNKKYKAGDAFYFKQFLQTKKKNYKQIISSQPVKETVFFVRSLSGRDLGKINQKADEQEVVFLPFTYFTIDQIIIDKSQNTTVEYIYMTEMQTLFNYKNPFLLWVDDLPNSNDNKKIQFDLKKQYENLQIMKLISTRQAECWMRQFAWLVNWQNIKFKMVSDMTRYEVSTTKGIQTLNSIKNNQFICLQEKGSAAIDLIQKSCDHLGFTTLITIFCKDKQNASKRLNNRNLVRGLNYHEIIINLGLLKQNIINFLKVDKN